VIPDRPQLLRVLRQAHPWLEPALSPVPFAALRSGANSSSNRQHAGTDCDRFAAEIQGHAGGWRGEASELLT
jgi:hypothetical protein